MRQRYAPTRAHACPRVPTHAHALAGHYNTVLAGLKHLQHPKAPTNVAQLRRMLATFLQGADAPNVIITSSGETLLAAATLEHTTLVKMANAVASGSGRIRGMGGTEIGAAASALFGVNIYTYQHAGG